MKKTYKAIVGNQVFKRVTERTYTHVVVAKRNPEHMIAIEMARKDTSYLDFYINRALGTGKIYEFESAERVARDVARGQEIIAAGGKEAYDAQKKQEYVDGIREAVAKGSFDEFFLDGWCGRLDLAQKKAASLRNVEFKGVKAYTEVEIVETQIWPSVK